MNPELEELIKALDAVFEARGYAQVQAKKRYLEKLSAALAGHPGINPELFERSIFKAHNRWVKASQRPPAI